MTIDDHTEQYVLVIGNPIGGFNFIGPFPSIAAAEEHGEPINEEWWVAPLISATDPLNHSESNHNAH